MKYTLIGTATAAILLCACSSNPTTANTSTSNTAAKADDSYTLPRENILVYRSYSYEDLIIKSGKKPSFYDGNLTPIVITPPAYPKSAFKKNQESDVIIECTVSAKGSAEQLKVLSDTTNEFAKNAATALKTWKFSPPRIQELRYTVTNVRVKFEYRIIDNQPTVSFKEADGTNNFYPDAPMPTKVK